MKTWSTNPQDEVKNQIPCGICGHSNFRSQWDCGSFSFVRCRYCGVYLQNPQPVSKDILERYDQEYFQYEIKEEEGFFRLMALGLGDSGFYRRYPQGQGRKFLDIGCATGRLLIDLRTRSWEVHGVEVCKPSATYARNDRGLDVFPGTLEQAAYSDDFFDVIHFSHLIEHLNDPGDFLKEVFRVLKPGGEIYLTTPRADGWQAGWFGPRWRSAIADHLYLFTGSSLKMLLKNTGFEILSFHTWGGLAKGGGPVFLKRILDPMAKAMGGGDVMLYRARKPLGA